MILSYCRYYYFYHYFTNKKNTSAPTTPEAKNPVNETNRRPIRRNNDVHSSTALRAFWGETTDLDAVLGLYTEKIDRSVNFEEFQDHLKNYVLKNLKRAEDVVGMITNIFDPVSDFETKNAPEDPSVEDQASMLKMKLWELKAKKYLEKDEMLQQNVNKLYAIIIGQCSPALKSALKADGAYTQKSNDFDALWLLKKLKVISAGVDLKENPLLTLHEQTINFLAQSKASTNRTTTT